MRNRDFDQSPPWRRKFSHNAEGGPFGDRIGHGRHDMPREGGHHPGSHHGDPRGAESPRRGGRSRRGDVRLAVLSLLAERPMHGYEMMQELADRTKGLWRPSPGALYPALQLLEDQGLVRSETADGRRQYTLTDEGRAALEAVPKRVAPWESMVRGANPDDFALRVALRQVATAVSQVAEAGTPEQKVRAEKLITELRRQMYLLLAETIEAPKQ